MKKFTIGIIGGIATIASTVAAIRYRKLYKIEVDAHWKTRYDMSEELKKAEEQADQKWELKNAVDDFARFIHWFGGDFGEWLRNRDKNDGHYDAYTDYEIDEYEHICKLAEEYYEKVYGNDEDGS